MTQEKIFDLSSFRKIVGRSLGNVEVMGCSIQEVIPGFEGYDVIGNVL